MKDKKFLYVYVDNENIIEEIETFELEPVNKNLYIIPLDIKSELYKLKLKWEKSYGYREKYILEKINDYYLPKRIFYVYYEKKKRTIKSISPVILQEYNNKELTRGKTLFTDLIKEFLSGKKLLSNYKIIDKNDLIEFENISNVVYEHEYEYEYRAAKLSKLKKIHFIEKGREIEIEIRYNRNKSELIIHCVYDLPISDIRLHFINKTDRTILYHSRKIKFDKRTAIMANIKLPKEFDIYSSLANEYKFLYREDDDQRN